MAQIAPLQTVMIGDVKATFLPDGGGVVNPLALYPASTEEGWRRHGAMLDEDGQFITSIGAFMVEIADRTIAVDLGIGPVTVPFPGFGSFSGGKYLESLARLGVAREAVTDVIFTHLHLDHCGWTTIEENGRRALIYPNARYRVSQTEWNFWYGGDNPAGPDPENVQKPLAARIEFMADGEEVAPGITALATPGHTPGHMSLRIESNGQRLFLIGDIFNGVVQLLERDWSMAFDADAAQARMTREAMYAELTRPDTLVGVNDFSDRVFGRVSRDGDKYAWTPLE